MTSTLLPRPKSSPSPRIAPGRSPRRLLAVVGILIAAAAAMACAPMGPTRASTVDEVDAERYLGTWYEVGSVKQFFSVGLVNVTADYQLNEDGSVRVENRGEYFIDGGPESRIIGNAVALDDSFSKLNVSFIGPAAATGLGNYWIVDLDPDYQWAIVSDPTGTSAFLLSRTAQVADSLYEDLLDRAAAAGVDTSALTRTPQF